MEIIDFKGSVFEKSKKYVNSELRIFLILIVYPFDSLECFTSFHIGQNISPNK